MSDLAKQARAAMKAKAKSLTADRPLERVDSSTFTPPPMLNADVKTGMRPVSRRAFKTGGKVEGACAVPNMGRKPRQSGGKAITANSLINRNAKDANEEREGIKHIGGMKKGGRAQKADGGPMSGASAMMKKAQETGGVPSSTLDSVPATSRMSRAAGLKKGGKVHEDVAADKALIRKMVKPSARSGKAEGGENVSVPLPSPESESPAAKMYEVVDRSTGNTYGPYKTWKSASRVVDRKDNDYGGYKHFWRERKKSGGQIEPHSRMNRATGGQVFSGSGYPDKIPGVVPGGRTARATGGKTKGKTNINIVIAAGKPAGMGDMMPNPMGGPTKPPGMDGAPGGIPIQVPPPAPGGAPMPMPMPMPPGGAPMPRKSGGRAKSYKDMTAGAGSGEGRLEKTEIAEYQRGARKAGGRTYRSYKDMDAGAGSGEGRLEKAEIASRKPKVLPGNY
jgi:hypothetical protein